MKSYVYHQHIRSYVHNYVATHILLIFVLLYAFRYTIVIAYTNFIVKLNATKERVSYVCSKTIEQLSYSSCIYVCVCIYVCT